MEFSFLPVAEMVRINSVRISVRVSKEYAYKAGVQSVADGQKATVANDGGGSGRLYLYRGRVKGNGDRLGVCERGCKRGMCMCMCSCSCSSFPNSQGVICDHPSWWIMSTGYGVPKDWLYYDMGNGKTKLS